MAENDSRLFAAIRSKTFVVPDPEFDRDFWDSFRHEFPQSTPARGRGLGRRLSLGFSLAALVTGSLFLIDRKHPINGAPQIPPVDVGFIQDLSHYEQLLDHYDEFASISDVSLSDKDWAELVKHGAR